MRLLELLNEEDDADKPKKEPAVVSSQDIGNGGSQEQTSTLRAISAEMRINEDQ